MEEKKEEIKKKPNSPNSLGNLLFKFKFRVLAVVVLALGANLLTLALPRISAKGLNSLAEGLDAFEKQMFIYGIVILGIFVIGVIQTLLSNRVTEAIASEIRTRVIEKISRQSFKYMNTVGTSRILTNLTSDVDVVKALINQGLIMIFSSVVLLIGAAISMLTLNWKLAIPVLLTVPALFVAFGVIFSRIGKYFNTAQEILDSLNKVISDSINGSALVRVLNSQKYEIKKFNDVNDKALDIGIKITNGFASLIPFITILSNTAVLIIVGYGGVQVIDQTLNVGDYSAFLTYVGTFIMPIILIGFIGSQIARSFASYERIMELLDAPEPTERGTVNKEIKGELKLDNISLDLGNRSILKNISFDVKSGSKTAILGPTAAGKTQIMYLVTGLLDQKEGEITIDGTKIHDFDADSLYSQVGLVFQDSIIFNTTVRENIEFRNAENKEAVRKAIETAELNEFIEAQPEGLETLISERGASLSGGQKQRLTLARALAVNPKLLLLDDFTARVDINTERKILSNIEKNYPGITLVSITQKIDSVKDFDQIILIMEGELIAKGKHEDLLKSSFEYQQIYKSQQSTE